MRAVRIHEYGGPEVLRTEEVPIPEPGPGQVLIAAEAVSVGFAQTQMRRNIFPAPMWRPEFPVTLGGDVIGDVVAVGPGVTGIAAGDRVGAFTLHGAYAEYVAVDADTVLPVPAELDAVQATALPAPGPSPWAPWGPRPWPQARASSYTPRPGASGTWRSNWPGSPGRGR